MALAFGASARGASFSSTNTLSWTSPTVSGTNTLGLVLIVQDGPNPIGTVTWNGVSCTEVTSAKDTATSRITQIFYIVAPAAGATTVAITTSSGNWANGAFAVAVYLTGADQSTPVDNGAVGAGITSNSISDTVNATNSGEIAVDIAALNGTMPSPSSPSTLMNNGNNGVWGFSSAYQGPVGSSGGIVEAYTASSIGAWTHSMVSINAAGGNSLNVSAHELVLVQTIISG